VDDGLGPAWANSSQNPILGKTLTKKGLVEWIKVQSPEFKLQHLKKKKKKKLLLPGSCYTFKSSLRFHIPKGSSFVLLKTCTDLPTSTQIKRIFYFLFLRFMYYFSE
jgi:hypothetical protein